MVHSIRDAVASLGLGLAEGQLRQLGQFRNLLAESANAFNLTSLRDPESIERRHILESLALGALLGEEGLIGNAEINMLDIGTGAGIPGIPLKIAWPEIHVTLLESVGKKCRFLEMACQALGLADIEVVEARAEDFGRDPARRAAFDVVVARAVAPLSVLLEYALPPLRPGGRLAAQKGSGAPRELEASAAALELLGGRVLTSLPFQPPHGPLQTVIVVEKVSPTPERFPRRAGIPSKRPL